ncbi:MAG: undecaprenyl/decaprenyl-phosphate alpha-N-acetylglucosaminyl 1-phosphate transferase [Candidatus Kerfeldbacteria bacterium]|nr:undecaprenyl/decaprenyl-phosphate alpha-N-acetylglucosaminyl 1-phosphate transferase [Candidatus Kerfeldbacteria bacterium]
MGSSPFSVTTFIVAFALAAAVSASATVVVRRIASRWRVVDDPASAPERKRHVQPTPLLGGVAIYVAFTVVLWGAVAFVPALLGGYLQLKHLVGMTVGGFLLMIGGVLDDRYGLRPSRQFLFPLLAAGVTIAAGIGIPYITNPLGGTIGLESVSWTLFTLDGLPYRIVLWADLFAFVWLLGMMYTTKFLDGLDGLVSGITVIGSLVLFVLSLQKTVGQPETAFLAILLAGAAAGFLLFNFHPARIFLGEGGSVYLGYLLGVVSIISGAKVATALLVMGIPILDVVWLMIRRTFIERRTPTAPDAKHLHFRLLDAGFSHRGAVFFLYALTAGFGAASLFVAGTEKLILLVVLTVVMLIIGVGVVTAYRVRQRLRAS